MTDLLKLDRRRRELGMSRATLARRAGLSLPTVQRILSGNEKSPSVSTVEALADALGMTVQIIETIAADDLREQQARKQAARMVGMVQGTMGLEEQAVDDETLKSLTTRNANRLLAGPGRRLWEE